MTSKKPINKFSPQWLFLSWFGAGYAPIAPGTAGTAAAIPLVLLLQFLLPASYWGVFLYVVVFLALLVLGSLIANRVQAETGMLDDGRIVLDEVLGYMVTMFLIPISWQSLLLAFLLFRLTDIIKPWPACWVDKKVKNGWGVMLDDVVAGFYSWLAMFLLFRVFEVL